MLLSYTSFSNPGSGQVLTGGGISGSVDATMGFAAGGVAGMPASGGPASAEPAPALALAGTTSFTGPTNDEFTYNAGVGSALVNANLVFAHQNAAASINVTVISPATTQNGIVSPGLSSANPVGGAFNFTGTPAAVGTTTFQVTLNDGTLTKVWSIRFVVASTSPPQITSTAPTTGNVGSLYSYNITATGTPTPTFSVSGNPAWLTLTGSTLSGTPTATGTYGPITVTATNGVSPDDTEVFSITVAQALVAPQITSSAVTTAIINVPYTYSVTTTGFPAPTLSVSGNPGWLTLTGNTLSGTPTVAGIAGPITLTATNGVNPDATQVFSITIAAGTAPLITSAAPTTATVGILYSYTVTTTGTPSPTITAAGLPAWLSLSGGTLSGTPQPADAGTSANITITANNGVNPPATQIFTLQVSSPGQVIGNGGGGGGCSAGENSLSLYGWLALVLGLALFVRQRRFLRRN